MPLVMLTRSATCTFRRCVRNEAGEIIHTLAFEPGEPVDVPWEYVPAIEKDLFVVLHPVSVGPTGKVKAIEREVYDQIMADNALEEATAPQSEPPPPVEEVGGTDGPQSGRRRNK